MKRVVVLPLALLLLGMSGNLCDNDPVEPAQGNYDRVGDLALVVTEPDADHPRGILVIANPEMEQLRFYDTLDRAFVRAPNVYFPLAVRTGPSTSKLAVAPDDPTRVYALDSADDEILVVRTVADGDQEAYTPVGPALPTGRAPHDVAAVLAPQGILLFVSLPDEGAVQVLQVSPVDASGGEVAYLPLGDGAAPAGLAVDLNGEAVVVTDGARDTVAVVRVDTLAIERFIDVGGPSFDVVMGRVDPGDGMAPMALVLRRDAAEVAAVRLFRPGYREDRYALIARAAMPEAIETAYVPDQARPSVRTSATVCCPGITTPTEATLAWAAVVSSSGILYYLRFDGTRDDGGKGLLRLVDDNPDPPGFAGSGGVLNPNTAPGVWLPVPGDTSRPVVTLDPVDNYGDPPRMPLAPIGVALELEWEGVPPGGRNRLGALVAGVIEVTSDGRALTQRDLRIGDALVVDTAGRGALCPDEDVIERPISGITADTLTVDGLTPDEQGCLANGGPFTFSVHAASAYTGRLIPGSFLGRAVLDTRADLEDPLDDDARLDVPGLAISLRAAATGAPQRGTKLVLELTENVSTIGIPLSVDSTFSSSGASVVGYGVDALLPTAFVGGEVAIQGVDETTPRPARRLFLGLGARRGTVLELNETEVLIEQVIRP